jgi:hypothetical protein
MPKIYYENALGTEIEIDYRPYLLRALEISPLINVPRTSKGYGQDGESFREAYAEPRDFNLTIGIFDSNIDQAIFEFLRVFNPKLGEGTLTIETDYQSKEIKVYIDASPTVSYGFDSYTNTFAMVSISMTAYDPYFIDENYTSIDLVGVSGGFYWTAPVYFTDDFYLGDLSGSSKVLTNLGDVPAPLRFEWTGVAENPKLTLEDTEEFILLNRSLTSDERAIITTGYGDINVYIETLSTGAIVKDFSIVDKTSTFFKLPLGESTISFSADSGGSDSVVTIRYKNLYIGV